MSDNLISSLPVSNIQLIQLEHVSSSLGLPVSESPMNMVGQVSNNSDINPFPLSKEQIHFPEPVSCDISQNSSSILTSNQIDRGETVILDKASAKRMSLPAKRKAEEASSLNNSLPQQPVLANKRPANTGNDFGFLQTSGSQRRTAQVQSKLDSPGSQTQPSLFKKMTRNESMSGRSGSQRGPPAKKQTTQTESASKGQESSEAIRSKMRESLTAALALAVQKNNVSKTEKIQNNTIDAHQVPMDSRASELNSRPGSNVPGYSAEDTLPSKGSPVTGKTNDCQFLSVQVPSNEISGNGGLTFQEFQYTTLLPEDDVPFGDSFFVKDDLLQGNGLSWAFDFDAHMIAEKGAQNTEKPQYVEQEGQEQRNAREVVTLTPDTLALTIEAELFKLFGGVNKKYKEKGRSLLFNLKDRNNPELRERVMSGEITPERLCAMSAEELASKELSEWRTAKAEHFEQMVVLPDTEVDIRRLVKKTHKGEYQVEVERDDDIAAEVSGGTSMITQPLPKKEIKPHSPFISSPKDNENVAGYDTGSGNHDLSGSLIIPTDGTDLMQGMMVDELKDAEFLPPIVSLREFMESLDSEPPFENLSGHTGQKSPVAHKPSPKNADGSGASDHRPSESPKYASSKKADALQKHEADLKIKSTTVPAHQNVFHAIASKVEFVWEGNLQLHVSSSVSVGGLFQSGEKTSTREWPTSIEIKGRVRLDAFEKFLQELPNSRTRAVMILQFDLKDKLSEKERSSLSEAIGSFSSDERLGYAEPTPGVELYLCPPMTKITEMLNRHMPPKDRPDGNNPCPENALIGVVVWRRSSPISNNRMSPNSSSSHHKHISKQQQHISPPLRVQNLSSNVILNPPTPTSRIPTPLSINKRPEPVLLPQPDKDDEDDDIPPGFGPLAAVKDDDDLPEFNFSGGLNPPLVPRTNVLPQNLHPNPIVKMTQTPVDQVRELIQKYGQSGNNTSATSKNWVDDRNLGIEPWNDDDDDDDIPEWRPQPLQHQVAYGHLTPSVHHLPTGPRMAQMASHQPPRRGGLAHPPSQGGRWVQPPPSARWRRP